MRLDHDKNSTTSVFKNDRKQSNTSNMNPEQDPSEGSTQQGLSVFGLDPLQLSLEALADKTQESTVEISACSMGSVVAPNVAAGRRSRGLSRFDKYGFTEEMYLNNAPKCTGHGHIALLLKVKKTGQNQVCYFSESFLEGQFVIVG